MQAQLTQFYRSFELPWEPDPEEQRRFRRLLRIGLALVLVFGLILPFVHLPRPTAAEEAVPPRLARLMQQEQPKPPPPKPVEKPQEKPKPETKPTEIPKPVDTRKKMENSAAMRAIKDELADLRDQLDTKDLQSRQLKADVGKDARSERSLISSKVGVGSAGIVTAASSRGFGSGAGALSDHNTAAVNSRIAAEAAASRVTRNGTSGKASRSEEEIALVFDRNKGAIDALYARALRERADLQGKIVLQLTISPAGEVTDCRLLSSELNDPDLERKIVARVKLFRFEAKDVEAITARKTLEFFPT
ncbi:MAG: TonB family protein [Gammaproteobacteria bacterium]|nr:TonB family protein [Gammaproteobacteria bacterium]MDE2252525.1 TonB family protein [Gammaproteobacteria bacterium]